MKRAIFKLGTACNVASNNSGIGFTVEISPAWMDDENDWDLPVARLPVDDKLTNGTRIEVTTLRSDVSSRFDANKDAFLNDFKQIVSQHYSMIIEKGFEVKINDSIVAAKPFKLLLDATDKTGQSIGLKPYVFRAKINNINVEVYAGLYRRLPEEKEMSEEEEQRLSRDDAGWTIACNDRVVVYRDKTRLTGWGEANVPSFHGQFNAFAGLVTMNSDHPFELPLTTTKRGIDSSSEAYSIVKDYMREATKSFTTFTNKWKRLPVDREQMYARTDMLGLDDIRTATADYEMTAVRKVGQGEARRFVPTLPVPVDPDKAVRISYSRSPSEVKLVAKYLFGDERADPKAVGETTFDEFFKSAKSDR